MWPDCRFVGSNKWLSLFCLFCFVAKSIVSVSELNFSLYFLNKHYRVASFKVLVALLKVFSL